MPQTSYVWRAEARCATRQPAVCGGRCSGSTRPISLARCRGIRHGPDRGADFGLRVRLDGRLRGSASGLAPDDGHLGAGLRERGIDHRQRQDRPLVGAVTGVGGDADGLAVLDDLVVGEGGVVCEGQVDLLGLGALEKERAHGARDVLAAPGQGDFAARGPRRHPLEGLAADVVAGAAWNCVQLSAGGRPTSTASFSAR